MYGAWLVTFAISLFVARGAHQCCMFGHLMDTTLIFSTARSENNKKPEDFPDESILRGRLSRGTLALCVTSALLWRRNELSPSQVMQKRVRV
jgi:hypothetical protein